VSFYANAGMLGKNDKSVQLSEEDVRKGKWVEEKLGGSKRRKK
jgi:hypothetical protein